MIGHVRNSFADWIDDLDYRPDIRLWPLSLVPVALGAVYLFAGIVGFFMIVVGAIATCFAIGATLALLMVVFLTLRGIAIWMAEQLKPAAPSSNRRQGLRSTPG